MKKLIRHLENLAAALKFGLFFPIQTYLAIAQVTRRLRRPGIVEMQVGTDPQTSAACIEEFADSAPSLNVLSAILQATKERITRIGPNLAERSFAHVAEVVMPPELVRMHFAVKIDATDSDAAAVQTAAVPR